MKKILFLTEREIKDFVSIKPYKRSKQVPLLAASSVALPLFVGLYFGNLQTALPAALGGLVAIYYSPGSAFPIRMIKMMVCSFGFILSYAIGLVFSFNPIVSSFVLGVWAVLIHWVNIYYKSKPPGSFFFIMLAAMGCYLPYDLDLIPIRIGMLTIGTMTTCILAFVFSGLTFKKSNEQHTLVIEKDRPVSPVESIIIGIFMFLAFFSGHFFKFENPVWIPISCLAIMQGVSKYHIWQRTYHRIIGTFLGVALCWLMLSFFQSPLYVCILIFVMQLLVEMFITRHYALAVLFLTPLTILLSELGNPELPDRDILIMTRMIDIVVGSVLGCIGGLLIYVDWKKLSQLKTNP